jgi:esterase/lipase superfamily enzyme
MPHIILSLGGYMPVIVVYIPPRLVSSLVDLQKHQDTSFLFHESYDTHLMILSGHSSGDIFENLPLKKIAH